MKLYTSIGAFSPPPVRFSPAMGSQSFLRVKPFGALDAIIRAKAGEILRRLGVFVLLKVAGRDKIGFDLVDVSGKRSEKAAS